MNSDITDVALAEEGRRRVEWADNHMPVLRSIRARFEKEKPFAGGRIAACLHVTTETANLARTLISGGAEVALCASNPLSTQDDVAASLANGYGVSVFARRGEDRDTYYRHINQALEMGPSITLDDGADLVSVLHTEGKGLANAVVGGTEETTTGVIRLRSLAKADKLLYPIVAVNDAKTKYLFDNRYGTGQSTIDGILRATNILLAGQIFVVSGFGWCGRGLASRARGMGAQVVVTEVDPLRALEAVMEGFSVRQALEAARIADIWVTVTGDKEVIASPHFEVMKDGAILANSGHFNVEIDIEALEKMATNKHEVRHEVDEYTLPDGRKIYLLAEGRLVNLAAAEGHPASVMDMSFANQALAVEYLWKNAETLEKKVYSVPAEIDSEIARLKLDSMDIAIDQLTAEQQKYLSSWEIGT